jgi:hypothetical protein
MMRDMMKWCCSSDGKPDFDKMTQFMEDHDRASKFDAAGWALFFIWVGISWLADVGWGLALLGVAVITLGMQALRRAFGVRLELFWVLVGLGFAIAGLWEWLDIQLPLAPFILIAIGLALFFGRVWPKTSRKDAE